MRKIIAYLITIYQRRISPHKGYTCAHKGVHNGDSCSEYTKKTILEKGLFPSIKHIQQRFSECREAAQANQRSNLKYQRGDCDLGLSGCDSPDISDSCGNKKSLPIDCLSSCDVFHSGKKNRERDLWILFFTVIIVILLISLAIFI